MRTADKFFVVLGALVSWTGCVLEAAPNSDDDTTGTGGTASSVTATTASTTGGIPDPDKTMLRVIHASADAPAVDIWAKGGTEPLIKGMNYGDATSWLEVDAGTYDFEIRASPSTAQDAVVFATGPVNLEKGDHLSAIAAGLIGSKADANKFRILAVKEDFAPPGTGSSIVRVVHAAPDAPTVNVDLHDDNPASPEITSIDRFTASDAAGFLLSAGEKLQLGITAGGNRVTAFTTPSLPEGQELLVIATGLVQEPANEADGFALLAVGKDGALGFIKQNPLVYALHNGPDAPDVDLYAGKAKLVSGLSYGNIAPAVRVPPGSYAIDIRPAGADPASAPVVTAQTDNYEAGESYLTMAAGFLKSSGADGFRLATYAERFNRTAPNEAIVRVVHGSPDAPAVDVGVLNVEQQVNPVLVSNIQFPQASAEQGFSAGIGTIPLGVTPAGANGNVVASFHVTTAPGIRAFAVAAGALNPHNGKSFRLLVVNTAVSPWTAATVHPQPQ